MGLHYGDNYLTHETLASVPHTFMDFDTIRTLIGHTLIKSGRIDSRGYVQPLKIQRRIVDSDGLPADEEITPAYRPNVPVIPPYEDPRVLDSPHGAKIWNSVAWDPRSAVYDTLVHEQKLTLHPDNADRLKREMDKLDATGQDRYKTHYIHGSTYTHCRVDAVDALSFPLPERDFSAAMRVYIAGGLATTGIVRKLIESDVSFASAKIWLPRPHAKPQAFRNDMPIYVDTFQQLASVMEGLRKLGNDGQLPAMPSLEANLGVKVPDLPGVFIGQSRNDASFHDTMAWLVGNAMHDIAQAAPYDTARNRVSGQWLDKMAVGVIKHVHSHAKSFSIDPENHAFLAGQPKEEILAVAGVR